MPKPKKPVPAVFRGFVDLWQGFGRYQLWLNLAWEDVLQSYYRTKLGFLWAPASFALRIVVFFFLFSRLIGENDFGMILCYIALGFIIWDVTFTSVIQSVTLIKANANWIKSSTLPISIFSFQQATTTMFRFFLNCIPLAVLMYIFRSGLAEDLTWQVALTSALGVFVMMVNILWVQVFVGLVCARFRDVQHLIQASAMMMFLLTPVLWRPGLLGHYATLIYNVNPFAHFIAVVREPLLHGTIPELSWMVVGGLTIGGNLITWLILGLSKKNLVFWV